jgi:hypothetical protein
VTFGITVVPPATTLNSITVSPSAILKGQSGTGTVTLTAPAGNSGISVSLASSNGGALNVPSSVKFSKGSTTATFSIKAGTVATITTVTVTASYSGVVKAFIVSVNP